MSSTMPRFKLTYLPVRARAENIRMMLKYAGIEYENEIIGGAAWAAAKKSQPFDKLPVATLEDGTVIAQSAAISRWVAHFAGLLPADPTEAARQDMLFEAAQELCGGQFNVNPICNVLDVEGKDFATKKEAFMENWSAARENLATQLVADFFGGDGPLMSDFHIFHICDNTLALDATALDAVPKMAEWYKRMRSLPAVAAYLAERPARGIGAVAGGVGMPGSLFASVAGPAL